MLSFAILGSELHLFYRHRADKQTNSSENQPPPTASARITRSVRTKLSDIEHFRNAIKVANIVAYFQQRQVNLGKVHAFVQLKTKKSPFHLFVFIHLSKSTVLSSFSPSAFTIPDLFCNYDRKGSWQSLTKIVTFDLHKLMSQKDWTVDAKVTNLL